jgi:hypothetical protein
MMKITQLIVLLAILAACESANSFENAEVIETDSIETVVVPPEVKAAVLKPRFPLLGASTLTDYDLEIEHQYGGGDCMAEVLQYASGDNILTIDSMSCGDYGFTTTRYMLSNDVLQMVHVAAIDNMGQLWEEIIYDFRQEPYQQFTRKGVMNEQGGGAELAYQNNPSKEDLVELQSSPEKLKKAYKSLFEQEVED